MNPPISEVFFWRGNKVWRIDQRGSRILIRSFQEGTTLTERVVWKVYLENEELPAVLRKIVTISKINIEHIEVFREESSKVGGNLAISLGGA